MFWKRVTLFKLFGFPIRLDLSWFFIALLITWSLASALFPGTVEGLTTLTYWMMGVVGALGLFASVIIHEIAHSLVARRYDIPIEGITLFIFGGVAEMTDQPKTPRAEFLMAIAGPLASLGLSALFLTINAIAVAGSLPPPIIGVLQYLGWINGALGIFNMIPAFPLDGGRVLRSYLWHRWGNIGRATRTSANIGSRFGLAFMIAGGLLFISGNFIGGLWWFLIGQFMRSASALSYQQIIISRALEGEPVHRFMKPGPISVSPGLPVADFVEDYVYKFHHKLFPVTEQGALVGQVGVADVKQVAREDWGRVTIGDIAHDVGTVTTVGADDDAMAALSQMQKNRLSRLLVVAPGRRLVGILTLKDMLELFALKMDLESISRAGR